MFRYVVLALYQTITLQNMKTLSLKPRRNTLIKIKQSRLLSITQLGLFILTITISINSLTIIITKDITPFSHKQDAISPFYR